MSGSKKSRWQGALPNKGSMYAFYFQDPKNRPVKRELDNARLQYFYLKTEIELKTGKREALSGCLLSGNALLKYSDSKVELNQFDMFFVPSGKKLMIGSSPRTGNRLCLMFSPSVKEVDADFEVQRFGTEKFVPRGEMGSDKKMSTYRKVWTAIKNGFFMTGFTSIPNESLKQGVLTSVNLDKNQEGNIEIRSHIHPDNPEVFLYCISDRNMAVTQYLINPEGFSVCKDLVDGEGAFFPGYLGHLTFSKPTYKNADYCMYMWIIPTFGRAENVEPVSLKM